MNPKAIDVTSLRNNLSDVIDSINKDQPLIVKKRGKDRVVIIDIDKYEDYLAAQDPEYLQSIKEARASKKSYTLEEAFADVWDEVE